MEWKDGNYWYRNYFHNYCFNKSVFLIEIKFIFLKVVLIDLIKITLVQPMNLIKKYCFYWTRDKIIDLIKMINVFIIYNFI